MGIFSDVATESTIHTIVFEIETLLPEYADDPRTQEALKRIGRYALNQFDWSIPEWAARYWELFKAQTMERS